MENTPAGDQPVPLAPRIQPFSMPLPAAERATRDEIVEHSADDEPIVIRPDDIVGKMFPTPRSRTRRYTMRPFVAEMRTPQGIIAVFHYGETAHAGGFRPRR